MNSGAETGKWRFYLPIIAFLIVFFLLSTGYLAIQQRRVCQEKEQYRAIASNQSNIIKDCFDTATARAFTVRAVIVSHGGDTSAFQSTARSCYEEIRDHCRLELKNIAAAPGGVVEQVYPLEGNEALIGFDFMDLSRPGNREAVEAWRMGELVVTNPFQLVQGGRGLGARLPVFLGEDREFWGLVTLTLDFDKFMDALGLDALTRAGIRYELWYEEDGTRMTLQSSPDPPVHPVTCTFSMLNLEWNLSIAPVRGWSSLREYAVAFAVIALLAVLTAVLILDKRRIKEANDKLTHLAYFDDLTCCHSRQYVNAVLLNRDTGAWKDPEARYSLALVDVDRFKAINDTYGHALGDRTLYTIAAILEKHIKPEDGDCVVRYGGDEFVLLFRDITPERFEEKLKTMLREVNGISFREFPEARFSVSIGGEPCAEGADNRFYAMVKRADEKLYLSKKRGRNQYTI